MQRLMETWKNYITEIKAEGSEFKVISFDFDATLALQDRDFNYFGPNEPLLSLFEQFKGKGFKVYIVTSRKQENEVREEGEITVADFVAEHGLRPDKIIFTFPNDKAETLKHEGVILHFDDDDYELIEIDQLVDVDIHGVKVNFPDGTISEDDFLRVKQLLGETE